MNKEEFLESLKKWDGKYESLIPPTCVPDPANEKEFCGAAFRKVYGSNFYQECVLPIYEREHEEWLNDLRSDSKHVVTLSFMDYGDMWRYCKCADDIFDVLFDRDKSFEDTKRKAIMWVSVANLYDIFKGNPEAAKLWAKHMDEVGKEIAHKGARAVYDSGDHTLEGMADGVIKALYEAKPFNPHDLVYNLNFYVEDVWGSIMPTKQPEAMTM